MEGVRGSLASQTSSSIVRDSATKTTDTRRRMKLDPELSPSAKIIQAGSQRLVKNSKHWNCRRRTRQDTPIGNTFLNESLIAQETAPRTDKGTDYVK